MTQYMNLIGQNAKKASLKKVDTKVKNKILKIMGQHSKEIEKILGYVSRSEVIHKDDLVEI